MSLRHLGLAFALSAFALPRPALCADDSPTAPLPLRLVVLDVTGDDLPEKLYFGEDAARVELNLGDGRYTAVAQDLPGVRAHQVLVTDLDADGLLDVYLVGPDANQAWLGLGSGRFREAGAELGLADAGYGLSAERLDLDGDGLQDLLLHNATGDVLFRARQVAGRVVWERDPGTPEVDAGQQLAGGLLDLAVAMLTGALEPRHMPDDLEIELNLDERGRPAVRLSGRSTVPAGESAAETASAAATPSLTGVPAATPALFTYPDAKYVNDNAGEVDSADVVDGSLTGADVSTASGDVGIGTTSPAARLHVVAPGAVFPSPAVGRVVISGRPAGLSDGDAELRLADSTSGVHGMSLFYDGGQTLGAGIETPDRLSVYSTDDGGATYDGPYLTVLGSTGDVGIGTNAPYENLHVAGKGTVGTIMVSPADVSSAGGFSQIRLVEDDDGTYGMHIMYHGDTDMLGVWGTKDGNQTATGPHLTIARDSGRVGIQTKDPQASLGVKVISGSDFIFRGFNDLNETVFSVIDSGRVICKAVEIQGGGDLVEPFDTEAGCEPGTVVVIDTQVPGRLVASTQAFDRRVAGVVSGAGGVNPGLMLSQTGVLEGDTLVALTGRVYVKCSAEAGPIAPGDRLVTAALAGHAMKSDDGDRSDGAVIGKAMSALDEGTGLVLVLVNLQ